MQTRSPEDISPAIVPQDIWFVNGSGQAELSPVPIVAATPLMAFRSNGRGGIEIAVGSDPTGDSVWRSNGSGGIELNVA